MGLKVDRKRALEFGKNVKIALREVWTDPATDVFDVGFVSMPLGYFSNTHYEVGLDPRTTSSV